MLTTRKAGECNNSIGSTIDPLIRLYLTKTAEEESELNPGKKNIFRLTDRLRADRGLDMGKGSSLWK